MTRSAPGTLGTPPSVTYGQAVRGFDHSPLAALPSYAGLRQALNDLAGEAGEHHVELAVLLEAARDMTAATPYADDCERCDTWQWPHAVKRDGGWLTCSYRCPCGTPGPAATPRTSPQHPEQP